MVLNLDLSPPAVSASVLLLSGLSFDTAAGAESRAGGCCCYCCCSCCCCSLELRLLRSGRGSRSEVERQHQRRRGIVEVGTADRSSERKMARVRAGRALQRGDEDEGESHSRCPSLDVLLICKHVTCSSPDLPPSPIFSSSPQPSAVEVKLEDAMNT